MKYIEILESIEELDEVRMGASDLAAFVKTPVAQSMRAGFEAELCFEGLGGADEDDDSSPVHDYSDDPRARSINDIAAFYYDGDHNNRTGIDNLTLNMSEDYYEWRAEELMKMWTEVGLEEVTKYIEENEFDTDDAIEEYLIDTLELNSQQLRAALEAGKKAQKITSSKELSLFANENEAYAQYAEARDAAYKQLEEKVQEAMAEMTTVYDSARENWMEEQEEEFTERDWLEDTGIDTMRDVMDHYEINWPHWTYPESTSGNSYNPAGANALERSLKDALGVNVTASSGYHSTTRREGLWIIEPDGSLEAAGGDMPAEIISPPMPLSECLTKMREFFAWAKSEGAYSNESTGFHVGVSLPNVGGRVDYIKLALFLGDRYILDAFGRASNTYTASALEKIQANVRRAKTLDNRVIQILQMMRYGISKLALSAITTDSGSSITDGHGKYTSINLKGNYIEFRSMGGPTYIDNIDEVISTVQRYAIAMAIAADPNAYKEEYLKKLYKLLNYDKLKDEYGDMIQEFARYMVALQGSNQEVSAGTELSPETQQALKDFRRVALRQIKQTNFANQSAKQSAKENPPLYWWKVGVNGLSMTIEVAATDAEGAKRVALENVPEWRQQGRHPSEMYAERLRIALS